MALVVLICTETRKITSRSGSTLVLESVGIIMDVKSRKHIVAAVSEVLFKALQELSCHQSIFEKV